MGEAGKRRDWARVERDEVVRGACRQGNVGGSQQAAEEPVHSGHNTFPSRLRDKRGRPIGRPTTGVLPCHHSRGRGQATLPTPAVPTPQARPIPTRSATIGNLSTPGPPSSRWSVRGDHRSPVKWRRKHTMLIQADETISGAGHGSRRCPPNSPSARLPPLCLRDSTAFRRETRTFCARRGERSGEFCQQGMDWNLAAEARSRESRLNDTGVRNSVLLDLPS
jgi:hypothetical protein